MKNPSERAREIREELKQIQIEKDRMRNTLRASAVPVYDATDIEKTTPISAELIEEGASVLAQELINDPDMKHPVIIGIMNGSLIFLADLLKALNKANYAYDFDTIKVESYQGTQTGNLTIHSWIKVPVSNRPVVFFDDICETGNTYLAIKKKCEFELEPSCVKLMVMFNRQRKRLEEAEPNYAGFMLTKDAFVIGRGLDYDEMLRDSSEVTAVTKTLSQADSMLLKKEKALNQELMALRVAAGNMISKNFHPMFKKSTKKDCELIEENQSTLTCQG